MSYAVHLGRFEACGQWPGTIIGIYSTIATNLFCVRAATIHHIEQCVCLESRPRRIDGSVRHPNVSTSNLVKANRRLMVASTTSVNSSWAFDIRIIPGMTNLVLDALSPLSRADDAENTYYGTAAQISTDRWQAHSKLPIMLGHSYPTINFFPTHKK